MADMKTALTKAGIETAEARWHRLCREAVIESGSNYEQSLAVLGRKVNADAGVLWFLLAVDWRSIASEGLRDAAAAVRATKTAGEGLCSSAAPAALTALPLSGGTERASEGLTTNAEQSAVLKLPSSRSASTVGAEGQARSAAQSASLGLPSASRGPIRERQPPYHRIDAMAAVGDLIGGMFRLATMMPNGKHLRDCTRADLYDLGDGFGNVAIACMKLADSITEGGTVGQHLSNEDLERIVAASSVKEIAHAQ